MVNSKLKVAVIHGGEFSERNISLKSGQAVIQALDPKRYKIQIYDPINGLNKIVYDAKKIDVALIMMHGRGGEDGSMQGFLDLLGIPYQSSGVLGCALAMDKSLAKERFRLLGLPVVSDLVLNRSSYISSHYIIKKLGLPLIVKPAHEGSSYGVSIVNQKKDLVSALEFAFTLDNKVIIEIFLKGRELTCGILGDKKLQAFPLVEIIPDKKYIFFNYEAKYLPEASCEVCPAPLDTNTTNFIQELAKRAHRALHLFGCSRSDFILTENGPFLLETNAIPGMTHTSLFPKAAQVAGFTFPALVDYLINLALGKKRKKK